MIEANSQNFNEIIKESKIPTLVYFWSVNCKVCEDSNLFMFELQDAYKEKLKIVKVNLDKEFELVKRFGIDRVPVFFVFKNSIQVSRINGFRDKNKLEKELRFYF